MNNPSALVLTANRVLGGLLNDVISVLLINEVCSIVHTIVAAETALDSANVSLLLLDLDSFEEDACDSLQRWAICPRQNRSILVLLQKPNARIVSILRSLRINGAFDLSAEDTDRFRYVVQLIRTGATYWSGSIVDIALTDCLAPKSICRILSPAEQLVFAVIGDGTDDCTAADMLGFSQTAILGARREIHRKLALKHRGELMQAALRSGFVRISGATVVRPGLSLLHAQYRATLHTKRKKSGTGIVAITVE
jgi:DNA-binding NarL/FixJ family response regulator